MCMKNENTLIYRLFPQDSDEIKWRLLHKSAAHAHFSPLASKKSLTTTQTVLRYVHQHFSSTYTFGRDTFIQSDLKCTQGTYFMTALSELSYGTLYSCCLWTIVLFIYLKECPWQILKVQWNINLRVCSHMTCLVQLKETPLWLLSSFE